MRRIFDETQRGFVDVDSRLPEDITPGVLAYRDELAKRGRATRMTPLGKASSLTFRDYLKCPKCSCQHVYRSGHKHTLAKGVAKVSVRCAECGYRWMSCAKAALFGRVNVTLKDRNFE